MSRAVGGGTAAGPGSHRSSGTAHGWPVGWYRRSGVGPAQLDRLLELATLPTVELAVLPADRVGAPAWHGFIYREPADGGPPYVTLELLHGGPVLDDPAVVALYDTLWTDLWAPALHGDDATALIRRVERGVAPPDSVH